MLKIKDKFGHLVGQLLDEDTEPQMFDVNKRKEEPDAINESMGPDGGTEEAPGGREEEA